MGEREHQLLENLCTALGPEQPNIFCRERETLGQQVLCLWPRAGLVCFQDKTCVRHRAPAGVSIQVAEPAQRAQHFFRRSAGIARPGPRRKSRRLAQQGIQAAPGHAQIVKLFRDRLRAVLRARKKMPSGQVAPKICESNLFDARIDASTVVGWNSRRGAGAKPTDFRPSGTCCQTPTLVSNGFRSVWTSDCKGSCASVIGYFDALHTRLGLTMWARDVVVESNFSQLLRLVGRMYQ